jgi:hypothetical protein
MVYLTGSYTNYYCCTNACFNESKCGCSINRIPNTHQFPRPGSGGRGGNIDLFAKDFKLPQVFKASFAVDQKLPLGFVLTSEITIMITSVL